VDFREYSRPLSEFLSSLSIADILSFIKVADTKNNLYIGIKQSGAFQHSSFLRGSRISAAGLIIVNDGQLQRKRTLSLPPSPITRTEFLATPPIPPQNKPSDPPRIPLPTPPIQP